jgi:hypothetical protein
MSQKESDETAPPLITWFVVIIILAALFGAIGILMLSMNNPLALLSEFLS